MAAVDRNLVSRLEHAAYLGREVARAERSLASGEAYVQDAASEAESTGLCECKDACSSNTPSA